MNRQDLLDRLEPAEQHVVLGEKLTAHTRDIVAELERRGNDVSQALAFLKAIEEPRKLHLERRDRLKRRLHVMRPRLARSSRRPTAGNLDSDLSGADAGGMQENQR